MESGKNKLLWIIAGLAAGVIVVSVSMNGQVCSDTASAAETAQPPARTRPASPAPKQDGVNKQGTAARQAKVTFVELGSVNCIPCKMMQPVMDQIEKEYGEQVKVVFHDVWTEKGRPQGEKYGIRAIPTQVFLDKDGKEFFRHEGFFPKAEIDKVLKKQGVVPPQQGRK